MQELFDVIIIGSGAAGAHAAVPLVEAGLRICIIDGGFHDPDILTSGSARTFDDVRKKDPEQWKLFLGEDCSNIPLNGLEGGLGGGMASGNRAFVTRGTTEHLPLTVDKGIVTQSLAKGGLAAAWGGTCAYLRDEDLQQMGLSWEGMQPHYRSITERIGISGEENGFPVQPPLTLDHHATSMMLRAKKHAKKLEALQVRVLQPHAAVLTKNLGERKATEYTDMDYYNDPNRSVYRPQYTIDQLRTQNNCTYVDGIVVQRIEETPTENVVFGHAMNDTITQRWRAKRVILAAGAVNTARILLTSFGLYDRPIPFVAKPHVYTACLDIPSLGKKGPERRTSLCQLVLIDNQQTPEHLESSIAQLYSYRSLLLFRLLRNIPFFPLPETLGLLSLFAPSLMLADIRFPALPTDGHTMTLRKDRLHISCIPRWTQEQRASLRRIHKALRATGLLPVRTVPMPEASTSHHAGTVPISDDPSLLLACNKDGKVRNTRSMYVADASMFRCLPALPHTLTIMANAERVGKIVAQTL